MAYSIFRLLRLLSLLSFLLNSTYAFCGHSSNSSDRAALLAFKAENDGDNVLSNWNETTNFCSWKGVKCYDGPILDLWLRNFSLHGPISPFLSNLSCLRALDLSENSLEGPIPVSLGALASLLILDLSANMIESVIPRSFGMLKSLQYLNIARNRLRGKLPTTLFYNCTQLNVVDLSANNLHGSLPRLVGSHLRDLEYLILDSNNFTGSLPDSLSNLTKIKMLELDANFLSGPLPSDLVAYMPQLEILHLSYNNLLFDESGSSLTEFFASISNLTHLAELGLAGNLIKMQQPQKSQSLAQQLERKLPQGSLFDSLPFDSLAGNEFCGPRGFPRCPVADESVTHSHGLLVSVVCIVSASLFLLTVFFAARQNKVRSATDSRRNVLDLAVSHRRITYRELSEATGGFEGSRLIGSGSFGRVYKAILNDGSFVAVKVLQLLSSNSTRTFRRECQVLKCVRHRNLMRIITACVLEDFKALVLPYMTKGSLESLLHPQIRESASAASHLSLTERVCICSDVAEGMAYLHHHAPVQVIHCDLKPSNILLSEDMTALVSDFGIAKLVEAAAGGSTSATSASSTANLLRGSVGYVAPEYGYGMSASTKGDVYSFGIVVLETVTRKKPTDEMFDELISLPNWVKNEYRRNLDRVIDPLF
uniref:non-specific serine/threonine protein kinase n=1 Tax=Ananas comosus var. bracteatus TaxID=296719 RepID=A0A6V7PM90_ANACO|nr:unnamed protein product [Ananas comosus var. bracteatus]